MSGNFVAKKVRRGTKSCTECRRRKSRCVRNPPDARCCRNCEDRGTACTQQIYSSQPVRGGYVPSCHRISQLETEVARLSKNLRDADQPFSGKLADTSLLTTSEPVTSTVRQGKLGNANTSDDFDIDSNVLTGAQPEHLRSLFHNDWLCLGTCHRDDKEHHIVSDELMCLLNKAREALQALLPSKTEAWDVFTSESPWFALLNDLVPHPFAIRSQQQLLGSYGTMQKLDIDTVELASWLLDFAFIAHQSEGGCGRHPVVGNSCWDLSGAISDTIENGVLVHDKLLETVKGLGLALRFFRFQMSRGNLKKAWIKLRHIITISELMGLPRAYKAIQNNTSIGMRNNQIHVQTAQLWETICSADRLLGTMLNLPINTKCCQPINVQDVCINGVVQPKEYLARLTDIAYKLQCLDDASMKITRPSEIYASALELERDLRALAAHTPKIWWDEKNQNLTSDQIIQLWHYYLMMRIHLPFTMQQGVTEEYAYSHSICLNACQSVARRYQPARQLLPSGVFLSQILDLQALTATIVLILTSHRRPRMSSSDLHTHNALVDDLVVGVTKVMDEKSQDVAALNFARNAALTIRSLNAFLQKNVQLSNSELKLKVPLLGNIHVRRKSYPVHRTQTEAIYPQPFLISEELASCRPNEQIVGEMLESTSTGFNTVSEPIDLDKADWQWDYFIWAIDENSENLFVDNFANQWAGPTV